LASALLTRFYIVMKKKSLSFVKDAFIVEGFSSGLRSVKNAQNKGSLHFVLSADLVLFIFFCRLILFLASLCNAFKLWAPLCCTFGVGALKSGNA